VTVPGVIAGWEALHQKFGTLPFADLMEPAIEIAERGHAVASIVAHKWAAAVPELKDLPGYAETFMPRGRAPEVSELVRFPGHAKTLRKLAEAGPARVLRRRDRRKIAAFAKQHGGAMTADDLRNYRADWVEPIAKDYRGHTVHEIPPNGQGIAALIALGILEQFDVGKSLPVDNIESQHLQIEAMKLAFADVYQYVADPRSMEVTPEQMLDDAYLTSRAKLIDPKRATHFDFGMPKAGGTIYMSVADERGMMVSFIQSNYMGFGSGVVVPDTGISLQNRGCGFSMDPKSANVVEGGKRPFHTIIPASSPGGRRRARGGDELRRDGRRHAAARTSCSRSCACSTTASSRRPRATRRAGRSTATSRSTSNRRSMQDDGDGAGIDGLGTRSSPSTIRIWTSAPASTSGSSIATTRSAVMSPRATAGVMGWRRGSDAQAHRSGRAGPVRPRLATCITPCSQRAGTGQSCRTRGTPTAGQATPRFANRRALPTHRRRDGASLLSGLGILFRSPTQALTHRYRWPLVVPTLIHWR
jgi:hypothetical protein